MDGSELLMCEKCLPEMQYDELNSFNVANT